MKKLKNQTRIFLEKLESREKNFVQKMYKAEAKTLQIQEQKQNPKDKTDFPND